MSILASLRRSFVPVHPAGRPFVYGALLVALIGWWLWVPITLLALASAAAMALFFRDPRRISPIDEGLVLAPADGLVTFVGDASPPPELDFDDPRMVRVSIFLSILDVHVNRAPAGGRVRTVVYTPGLFLNADLDKASEDNERNALIIETLRGPIGVVQIAGLVARRIVCSAKTGDTVQAGERFGLIRFGSRCDVYVPRGTVALVAVGQRCVGGETVLADLAGRVAPRRFVAH